LIWFGLISPVLCSCFTHQKNARSR
jgi:hypothetical protein